MKRFVLSSFFLMSLFLSFFLFSSISRASDNPIVTKTPEMTSSPNSVTSSNVGTIFDVIAKNSVVNLVLGIIGIAGTVIGIKSFLEQRHTSKKYEEILSRAQTDYNGKYTQAEVAELQKKAKELSEEITSHIPIEAQKALINNKLDMIIDEIRILYKQYRSLQRKYSDLLSEKKLSPEIELYIERELKRGVGRNRWFFSPLFITITSSILFIYIVNSEYGHEIISRLIYYSNMSIEYYRVLIYALGISCVCIGLCLFRFRESLKNPYLKSY